MLDFINFENPNLATKGLVMIQKFADAVKGIDADAACRIGVYSIDGGIDHYLQQAL